MSNYTRLEIEQQVSYKVSHKQLELHKPIFWYEIEDL
jgi:hypothetical protein